MDHLKMYFLHKMRIFHCHVSLPEGSSLKNPRDDLPVTFPSQKMRLKSGTDSQDVFLVEMICQSKDIL